MLHHIKYHGYSLILAHLCFEFISSLGSNIDPVLGQGPSVRPTEEESEDSAIMKMITSAYPPPLPPMTLYDLLDAMQVSF